MSETCIQVLTSECTLIGSVSPLVCPCPSLIVYSLGTRFYKLSLSSARSQSLIFSSTSRDHSRASQEATHSCSTQTKTYVLPLRPPPSPGAHPGFLPVCRCTHTRRHGLAHTTTHRPCAVRPGGRGGLCSGFVQPLTANARSTTRYSCLFTLRMLKRRSRMPTTSFSAAGSSLSRTRARRPSMRPRARLARGRRTGGPSAK